MRVINYIAVVGCVGTTFADKRKYLLFFFFLTSGEPSCYLQVTELVSDLQDHCATILAFTLISALIASKKCSFSSSGSISAEK